MMYSALDFCFTITAPAPLDDALRTALLPLHVSHSGNRDVAAIVISHDDEAWWITHEDTALRAETTGKALARTLEHINQRAAASLVIDVPFHAAAVRHPTGGVVALVGSSGAGKSTLGAAALRAGWGFLAEEIAAVDPTTRAVRPYHRPIGLRSGGAAALAIGYPTDQTGVYDDVFPWPVPAADRHTEGTLIGIALVSRNQSPVGIDDVSPAPALAELIEHTVVPDDDRVVDVFRTLDRMVRDTPIARLVYDTPRQGMDLLNELVRRWT